MKAMKRSFLATLGISALLTAACTASNPNPLETEPLPPMTPKKPDIPPAAATITKELIDTLTLPTRTSVFVAPTRAIEMSTPPPDPWAKISIKAIDGIGGVDFANKLGPVTKTELIREIDMAFGTDELVAKLKDGGFEKIDAHVTPATPDRPSSRFAVDYVLAQRGEDRFMIFRQVTPERNILQQIKILPEYAGKSIEIAETGAFGRPLLIKIIDNKVNPPVLAYWTSLQSGQIKLERGIIMPDGAKRMDVRIDPEDKLIVRDFYDVKGEKIASHKINKDGKLIDLMPKSPTPETPKIKFPAVTDLAAKPEGIRTQEYKKTTAEITLIDMQLLSPQMGLTERVTRTLDGERYQSSIVTSDDKIIGFEVVTQDGAKWLISTSPSTKFVYWGGTEDGDHKDINQTQFTKWFQKCAARGDQSFAVEYYIKSVANNPSEVGKLLVVQMYRRYPTP